MRKKLLSVLLFWLVILGGFVGYREYLLRTGAQVLLHTMPVDPRDIFMGDYIRLGYPISMIDMSKLAGASSTSPVLSFESGDTVYVMLTRQDDGSYAASRISKGPQPGALQIRGTVSYQSGTVLYVSYGIEQYYIPEGSGAGLGMASGKKIDVIVALSSDGTPAIKELLLNGAEAHF